MPSDLTERALEARICAILTGRHDNPDAPAAAATAERPAAYGVGWSCGSPDAYDRENCVDLAQLAAFLQATQPEIAAALSLDADTYNAAANRVAGDSPLRRRFLARLKQEIDSRGVVDVLRKGIKHGPHDIALYYATPTPGNDAAAARCQQNRFTVTRQLRYSAHRGSSAKSLDLGLFINGLPVITAELKNSLTKQTAADAVAQYRNDRDPREPLFRVGRCLAHFAVDDQEALFGTELAGKSSVFLPFNKGWNDGAGNPPNPNGVKTDYLWQDILARDSLADIIEHYALLTPGPGSGAGPGSGSSSGRRRQIWPRYHQLDAVRRLLAAAAAQGVGQRYLIQHSAGSGKSNSIAWLSQRLIALLQADGWPVFDTVIVVTDRLVLDRQINDTIRQFTQVSAIVGHAVRSGDLRRYINEGRKVIITTAQKFPFILDEIDRRQQGRKFAIIIDEAHSGQGGRTASAMSQALRATSERGDSVANADDDNPFEDQINRIIASRRLLPNASYFAFTATPKNRTLELFGIPSHQPDGAVKYLPYHIYTMKQAIQEGFILDVLSSYTEITSYYNLVKTIAADPQFDSKRAQRKLRRFVENHRYSIRQKAEIMVDHFHDAVIAPGKVNGQARAMVVTDGVARAIEYYHAVRAGLAARGSPYRAIAAFSGAREYGGQSVTEADLNGFPSAQIPERIRQDPYRILICADKFQTGYDEPLLHTMYVDKTLAGIRAVQTLSRLNRAGPGKHDVFVLDFMNNSAVIGHAFSDYYRTTILADATAPDRLHDLKARLDGRSVYTAAQVEQLVAAYLSGGGRNALDPILDRCVAVYRSELDEDGQVEFKGRAKAFCRLYDFLSQVLPYGRPEWERLSIFLNLLIPKLPAPAEDDLSRGILETVDLDSYRAEKQATISIKLADADAEIDPVPTADGSLKPEPELDALSNILSEFNTLWGTNFTDADHVGSIIAGLPARVAADTAYNNARHNSDRENARLESNRALYAELLKTLQSDTELYKQFTENREFQDWLSRQIFEVTYAAAAA